MTFANDALRRSHIAVALPRQDKRSPGAILALALLTFLQIGRAQEIFLSLASFRLTLIVAILTILCALTLPRVKAPWAEPEVRLALVLFGYAALTIPISMWPRQSFQFVIHDLFKLMVFFVLIVYSTRSAIDLRRIVWAVVAGVALLQFAILAGYSGVRLRGGEFVVTEQHARVWVTAMYDPNDLALMMVCALPLALALFSTARGLARLISGVIALLCGIVSIWAGSRGGFVALVAVCGILLWSWPGRAPLRRTGVLVGLILLFLVFTSDEYWERISTIWSPNSSRATDYDSGGLWTARWTTWTTAVGIMLDNFPLGVGAGAYSTAEGLSHAGAGKWDTAHNAFLQVGAELGVVGLIVFLAFLYRGITNCRSFARSARTLPDLASAAWIARGIETSLYGFIVGALSLSQGYAPILYLLIGLSAVLRHLMPAVGQRGA